MLDLFLLCCMMQRSQEQITFLAGVEGAKLIPSDFQIQQKWTQPGWFEDSFSLNFGLLGSAGSVPTVLHDATDTGTEYILKHLMVVGSKGGKMMPMQRT